MLTRTIKYTDFNGAERSEEFHFNFTRKEMLDMQSSVRGGLAAQLDSISKSDDLSLAYKMTAELILDAYGIKDDEARVHRKTPEIRELFAQSAACDQLIWDLLNGSENDISNFMMGCVPPEMVVGSDIVVADE